jgi:hypothetical protein
MAKQLTPAGKGSGSRESGARSNRSLPSQLDTSTSSRLFFAVLFFTLFPLYFLLFFCLTTN